MYRPTPDLNDCVLVTGDHKRCPVTEIALLDGDELVDKSPLEIFSTILETLKKSSSMVIEED